jgi:hypothetical protein
MALTPVSVGSMAVKARTIFDLPDLRGPDTVTVTIL